MRYFTVNKQNKRIECSEEPKMGLMSYYYDEQMMKYEDIVEITLLLNSIFRKEEIKENVQFIFKPLDFPDGFPTMQMAIILKIKNRSDQFVGFIE